MGIDSITSAIGQAIPGSDPAIAKRGTGYASYSDEWFVEVFDWNPPFPESKPTDSQDVILFGNQGALSQFQTVAAGTTINKKGGFGAKDLANLAANAVKGALSPKKSFAGVVNIEFTRSKDRVDNQCVIRFVGPIPPAVRGGNWVIVWSAHLDRVKAGEGFIPGSKTRDEAKCFPRFIGQIHTVETSYQAQQNGNITSTSTIQVREWSALLLSPLKFDILAQANLLSAGGIGAGNLVSAIVGKASDAAKSVGKDALNSVIGGALGKDTEAKKPIDIISKLCSAQFNPYQFGAAILWTLAGLPTSNLIEENGLKTLADKLPPKPLFWDFAMSMPSVPKSLLNRLGMSDVDPDKAFQEGFLKFIVGRQTQPMLNGGDWRGVFKDGEIDEWSENHNTYSDSTAFQPSASNMGVLVQLHGQSAWQIIQQNCDSQLNDIFTDMVYESTDDGNIRVRPTVYIRGKSFRFTETENLFSMPIKIAPSVATWGLMDDLPRIRIDATDITSMSIRQTILDTPTYIRPTFRDSSFLMDKGLQGSLSMIQAQRLNFAMRRFGGRDLTIESSYYGTTDLPGWSLVKVWLGVSWYGQSYRAPSGTITIKNGSTPISIGMNIQFTIGKYELVAHVESVSESFSIDPDGTKSMKATISFSRLCVDDQRVSTLSFLPDGAATDIYNWFNVTPSLVEGVGKLADIVGNGLNAVSSLA